MNYLSIGLIIALAVSLLGNVGLGKAYMGARDERTQAISDRDSARTAATACSDSVDDLFALAKKRTKDAAREVLAAKDRARAAESRARAILAAPQKVPGDTCASAQAEVDEELGSRP